LLETEAESSKLKGSANSYYQSNEAAKNVLELQAKMDSLSTEIEILKTENASLR